MTYGIAIRNEFNENLVDVSAGLTYYRKSSGVCRLSSEVPVTTNLASFTYQLLPSSNFNASARLGVVNYTTWSDRSPNILWRNKIHYATPSFRTVVSRRTNATAFNTTHYFPDPVSENVDDLVFFRMPSEGIMSMAQTFIPFSAPDINGKFLNLGLHAYCIPWYTYSGPALPFLVVSSDLPPQSNDTHGLVVYDTNGSTILFDTTREIASFVDHISVSAAQAQNIIINNSTLTFNLRAAVSNPWISTFGAGGKSYKSSISGNRQFTHALRVQQTSSTQIVVSRAELLAPATGSIAFFNYENYADSLFLIGDFD